MFKNLKCETMQYLKKNLKLFLDEKNSKFFKKEDQYN